MSSEQVELARIVVGLGGNRLVVPADLGVVVVLELEGELHQRLGDVSGGFIGEVEFVRLFCARGSRGIGLLVDLGLGAEALAFDDDGIDVM